MSHRSCPGAANITGTPTLEIKKCPECGETVEVFSTDREIACPGCGFIVFNDLTSCLRWCRYAEKCLAQKNST